MTANLRVYELDDKELETVFSGPFKDAGYIDSVRTIINQNNWWPCYVREVLTFLKENPQ